MPKYRLPLIRIFPYMDRIISVFSSTGTESPIKSKYRKIQIRKSPNFITFHAVINFVCCGGPRNVFVMSTSRFFPKPIGVIHIWGPLWGEVVEGKNEMLSDLGGGGEGVFRTCTRFLLLLLLKIVGLAPWSNIMLSQTRNLSIDSVVRHWSHPVIIPLHCLYSKLNNRTRSKFEYDVTWFCFSFDFFHPHARCGYCSIVCWRRW